MKSTGKVYQCGSQYTADPMIHPRRQVDPGTANSDRSSGRKVHTAGTTKEQ